MEATLWNPHAQPLGRRGEDVKIAIAIWNLAHSV